MSAPVEAERLIKDAFYDAQNAGSTMDAAAATAVKKLASAGLLAGKDVDFPNDPTWWLDWSNDLTQLIPDGDESRYSNPEGAQESIVTDCFQAYRRQLDKVGQLVEQLSVDLAKAEPKHFSIGLMRGRVKELSAVLGFEDES